MSQAIQVEATATLEKDELLVRYVVQNVSNEELVGFSDQALEPVEGTYKPQLHKNRAIVIWENENLYLVLGYVQPSGNHRTGTPIVSAATRRLLPGVNFSGSITIKHRDGVISEWNPNSSTFMGGSPYREKKLGNKLTLSCMYFVPSYSLTTTAQAVGGAGVAPGTEIQCVRMSLPTGAVFKSVDTEVAIQSGSLNGQTAS